MTIRDYLDATRSFYGYNPEETNLYNSVLNLAREVLPIHETDARVLAFHMSSNGFFPEVVECGNEFFILTERSFARMNGMWSALQLRMDDELLFDIVILRTISEILLKHADYFSACCTNLMAEHYINRFGRAKFQHVVENPKIQGLTNFQQLHVVLHEYMHIYLSYGQNMANHEKEERLFLEGLRFLNEMVSEHQERLIEDRLGAGYTEEILCDIMSVDALLDSKLFQDDTQKQVLFWSTMMFFLSFQLFTSLERQFLGLESEYSHLDSRDRFVFERDGLAGYARNREKLDATYFAFEQRRDAIHQRFSDRCFKEMLLFDNPCGDQYFEHKSQFEIKVIRKSHRYMKRLDRIRELFGSEVESRFGLRAQMKCDNNTRKKIDDFVRQFRT